MNDTRLRDFTRKRSPLNMHEHSPRLFRGDYSLYIRAKRNIKYHKNKWTLTATRTASPVRNNMSRRITKPTKWSVFVVAYVSSCGQGRLWSNWAYAQADLSLRWAQMSFCLFFHVAADILKIKDIIYLAFLFSKTTLNVNWNLPYNLLQRPRGRAFSALPISDHGVAGDDILREP